MHKTTLFLMTLLIAMSAPARAAITPLFTDVKPSSQQMIEKQNFGAPAAADTSSILSSVTGPTSAAAASTSTFAAQPDVPRNLVITPTGTTADVRACVITVSGTNFYYKPISEAFTFASAASTTQTGAKAFRTVTQVAWPANCEGGGFGATWSMGKGSKLGLKNCIFADGDWLQGSMDGVYEGTRATVVGNSTAIESNTAQFATSLNGSHVPRGYFMQSFLCKP